MVRLSGVPSATFRRGRVVRAVNQLPRFLSVNLFNQSVGAANSAVMSRESKNLCRLAGLCSGVPPFGAVALHLCQPTPFKGSCKKMT